ncbi:DNA-directed RNA polymerase subunit beta [Streptohalobacillus salinus]|uniref:DNA-directed RNA polymerase subunit beta n=1 Tax=Streptohalobacillus salinus TaxID=621096 RepID=A0A2V3WBU4_9BACI|nr:DNA-directed RNA polymerase subunit beta [Streptohalobacillus salinus]PXW92035.1 DNA-directed RNA polymerase subunit beta [Streptohalobacillus salinus]
MTNTNETKPKTASQPREVIDEPNNREVVKEEKKAERKAKRQAHKEKYAVRRIFPIWLRIIVIVLLSILALIIGLIVGYSVLGNGEPLDVLKFEFWQHVLDIIQGVE